MSIQGEAAFTGYPVIFVRLTGCNLSCEWCDTKYHTEVKMSFTPIELNMYLKKEFGEINILYPIVFTGGEPLLQYKDIVTFSKLESRRLFVETNGTIDPFSDAENVFNWITCSPKNGKLPNIGICNELKVVVDSDFGPDELAQYTAWAEQRGINHLYLQPCAGNDSSLARTIALVTESFGKWRLGLQTHKLINIA